MPTAGLVPALLNPMGVVPPPAFGGFTGAAALMGANKITSTGMPQNANPLLAPSKTIHVGTGR